MEGVREGLVGKEGDIEGCLVMKCTYLEYVIALPWPQTTHKLYQGGCMGVGHTAVNIHAHLIDSVYKL